MFSRKDRAERTAAQAWDYLSSAMTAAGERARDVGKHTAEAASAKASELAGKAGKTSAKLAGKASSKVTDEAWARANAAANALAGRRPPMPWRLLVGFGLIGVALGWVAATAARAALERQAEKEELELTETAVVVTPTYDT